jgi:hypothetical protein
MSDMRTINGINPSNYNNNNNLKEVSVKKAKDVCDNYPGCQGFSYFNDSGKIVLYSNVPTMGWGNNNASCFKQDGTSYKEIY